MKEKIIDNPEIRLDELEKSYFMIVERNNSKYYQLRKKELESVIQHNKETKE